MAIIPHGTPVTDLITPGLDDANTFPTHAAKFGKGGFEVRDSLIDIQTISADRREGKFCLSLLEKEFYYFDSTTQTWKIYPITGSGTADDWMTVLGVTLTPTLVSFDRPIYTPKLSTAPGTVSVGNIDISGANNTLSFINTTDGTRAILVGVVYKPDGSTSLRSYELTSEEVHERQMDFSDVQPTSTYTFPFTVPEDVIRTGLFVMPAEAGEFTVESKDINGKLITDSETFTFRPQDIGNTVEIPLLNHVTYFTGQTGTFTHTGAKVRGKIINGTFIPYFKVREYSIISRPEVVTEVNISELHEESVSLFEPNGAVSLPTNVYNIIVKYTGTGVNSVAQVLPDITKVKMGTRIWLENTTNYNVHITPYNSQQTIHGSTSYPLGNSEGITFIADKKNNRWIMLSPYVAKEIISQLLIDGGSASSTFTSTYDGGTASSTFDRTIDAGGA